MFIESELLLPLKYISNKVLFDSFHTHIPEFSVFWLSPRKGMLSSFFLKYFDSSPKFSPLEIKKLIKDFKQLTLTVDRNTFGKIKKERLEVELLSSYEFYYSNINNAWFSQIKIIYNSFSDWSIPGSHGYVSRRDISAWYFLLKARILICYLQTKLTEQQVCHNLKFVNISVEKMRSQNKLGIGNVLLSCRYSQKINGFIKGKCNS